MRPAVDIVVPFVGTDEALAVVVSRLRTIALASGDTIRIADNRPSAAPGETIVGGSVAVVGAAGTPSSYFARNRGAEVGENPWIVFIDADVDPASDLLDAYFAEAPAEQTGILIGGIYDEEPGTSAVEQFSYRRAAVGHVGTLREDGFSFAQTANVAIRRSAYDAVAGFNESIRSGGDADICFRIQREGFSMEPRFDARVTHENRKTVKAFARQYARYGSGAEWLEQRYPGFAPAQRPLRVVAGVGASCLRVVRAVLRRDRVDAQVHAMDAVQKLASSIGRRFSNNVAA